MSCILLVDDEDAALAALEFAVPEGATALSARSAEEAVEILERRAVSAVLCDLNMPGAGGRDLLQSIKRRWPTTEVAVVTAVSEIASAVECMRLGAIDYVTKPWDLDTLRRSARRWIAQGDSNRAADWSAEELRPGEDTVIGGSAAAEELRQQLRKAAGHDTTVLLRGAPGSGKRLAAASIHAQSARRNGPFVAVDCRALAQDPEGAALFGVEREAGGAVSGLRPGAFDQAERGTLLLENIETLGEEAQRRLLDALVAREVRRLGSGRRLLVDVRILSTTGADLRKRVDDGLFNKDLYFRVIGIPLDVPDLEARAEDKLELAGHFLDRLAQRQGRRRPELDPRLAERILARTYAGNVEELEDLVAGLYAGAVEGDFCLDPVRSPAVVADPDRAFDRALDYLDGHASRWRGTRASGTER